MRIRLAILSCIAAAILFGFSFREARVIFAGSVLYAFIGVLDLFRHYRIAKLIRAKSILKPASTSAIVGKWLAGIIDLVGLVFALVTQDRPIDLYFISGWIIWGSALICWFLSGIIFRKVGGVPLSMGYGGWAIRRGRNGRILG